MFTLNKGSPPHLSLLEDLAINVQLGGEQMKTIILKIINITLQDIKYSNKP